MFWIDVLLSSSACFSCCCSCSAWALSLLGLCFAKASSPKRGERKRRPPHFFDISNRISTKRVCVKRSLLKRPARARSARARAPRDRRRLLPSCVRLLLSYLLSCFSWSCRSCLHCSCCSVFSCFACNARRSLASRASRYMIARFFEPCFTTFSLGPLIK